MLKSFNEFWNPNYLFLLMTVIITLNNFFKVIKLKCSELTGLEKLSNTFVKQTKFLDKLDILEQFIMFIFSKIL